MGFLPFAQIAHLCLNGRTVTKPFYSTVTSNVERNKNNRIFVFTLVRKVCVHMRVYESVCVEKIPPMQSLTAAV